MKSERYFDLYDQIFAHTFQGAEFKDPTELELSEVAKGLLAEWLRDPSGLAHALGIDEKTLSKLSPDELIKYFLERLKEQTEAHHGGSKWIGTGGTSPVGHSGYHPGGMRVGGVSRNKSAVKVAMERLYRDYSQEGPLTEAQMGEALKRLRNMVPFGPKNRVNIDKTNDVEAELDDNRLTTFLSYLAQRTQTLLTTAKESLVPLMPSDLCRFEVDTGTIRSVQNPAR